MGAYTIDFTLATVVPRVHTLFLLGLLVTVVLFALRCSLWISQKGFLRLSEENLIVAPLGRTETLMASFLMVMLTPSPHMKHGV